MNKKARIDTYSTIYDMDFIVANEHVTLDELKKLFTYDNEEELDKAQIDWDCCTSIVKRKKDGATCLLVKFNKIGKGFTSSGDELLDLIDISAHEATHVAIDIYNRVSATIDTENQECFAYFVGYITERILKTLLNK